MTKIYVSPETLKKLSKKGGYNEVLNHFDVNRPEPKRHCKTNKTEKSLNTKNRQSKVKKPKQSKSSNRIKYITLNILKHPSKKSKRIEPQQKILMGDITEHRYATPTKQSATFFYSPSSKNHNSATAFMKGRITKNSRTRINYLKEHHLLADQSALKLSVPKHQYVNIKSRNNSILTRNKKAKKPKRNWTDRFALK